MGDKQLVEGDASAILTGRIRPLSCWRVPRLSQTIRLGTDEEDVTPVSMHVRQKPIEQRALA